jgi:GNAT superfamily N-acetyltransferase/ABC-type thiamine transport system ATPase subunit
MTDWKPLERSSTPLVSSVVLDEITQELIKPFDYESDGTEKFYPYLLPTDLPKDFGIGVIVGASGTGKSTLLKSFGSPVSPVWNDGSIVSNFANAIDANEKLSAAGLMSVPEWVKPFSVLSNGQQFRANLARSLHNEAVIDEFTSVIDRNVAKAASTAMARYVRKNNVKGIVLATCHRDVLEYLEPDWIIDTDRGEWASGRYLHRPDLVLGIYPCSNEVWEHFAPHHYLSESLNKSAHCYLALWNGSVVGFVASIAYPSGTVKEAYREHRLVVHPDFQGFGIGPRLSEAVAQHYLDNGKRYFSKTSHPRLGGYRDQSALWKPTSKNHKRRTDGLNLDGKARWSIDPNRWSYSHEYVGIDKTISL